MSPHGLTLACREADIAGGVELVVTRGETVVQRGPAPPHLARRPSMSHPFPGLDLDVEWVLTAGPLGPSCWLQQFRSGGEVAGATPCSRRLELEVGYTDMIRICYGGEPFERVLTPEQILPLLAPLSCLTGLLHGPWSLRVGYLAAPLLEVVIAWSERWTHVPGATA
jgi:hypothetical protein